MKSNKKILIQYAGFGFQLIFVLGLAVFGGHWLDAHTAKQPFPLWVWVFPLLVLVGSIFKVIKDTSKK